jgi:hypothetical protein
MWKNIVEPVRPQMTIWRMGIACCSPMATKTHSEYVILLFHCNSGCTKAPTLHVHCLSYSFLLWTSARTQLCVVQLPRNYVYIQTEGQFSRRAAILVLMFNHAVAFILQLTMYCAVGIMEHATLLWSWSFWICMKTDVTGIPAAVDPHYFIWFHDEIVTQT